MATHTIRLAGLMTLIALVAMGCATMDSGSSAEQLKAALLAGDRSDTDKERDAGRKPAEVLEYLGIGEGMVVMDVIASGGYYSEVLSYAVGESGTVYAQNPAVVRKLRDGAFDRALTERLANNRLSNVKRWDREISDLGVEPGSLDAAITALNLHDVYNNSPEAALGALIAIKAIIKPGGVLGVIDHHGNPGADNKALHRMLLEQAIAVATKAGFVVEQSDILANPEDDRSQIVFAPAVRGKTDRFLLKLVKP